jgi:threonine-phosphate decarboxylase
MINGHGDDAYRYTAIRANFSSNVYHRVNHDGLNCYLAGCLSCIRSYPEPEPYALAAELARLQGVSPEEVCVTNGATEGIYLIAQAFRGSHSAVWIPTFSEYADACRLHGHRVEGISSLEKLTDDEGIFWLCNPNNPTGQTWDAATLRRLIATYPRSCLSSTSRMRCLQRKRCCP